MENALPTAYRISEFYQWFKAERVNFRPAYQRKPVWSTKNKSYLMDTILNGLPIPEVYVQIKTDKNGNTKYEIVDGQQRLKSIIEFIKGEFSLIEDEETAEYRGISFSELSDEDTEDFWSYPLVVRELRTNSYAEVTGIFKRLNKNVVPLNQQELRHASYSGHFIRLVEYLADKDFWPVNKIVNNENIRRMKDAEYVSELLVAIMDGVQDGTKTLEKYYKLYDVDFPEKDAWDKSFRKTQQTIEDIFADLRGTHWNSKSDFYALFVAVSELLRDHIILIEKHDQIKKHMLQFRQRVNWEKSISDDATIREYSLTLEQATASKENRTRRIGIVKKLLLPYTVSKDPKHNFTNEQKQFVWDSSIDKKCAICRKKIEHVDYVVAHKIPYTKGGMTIISNSQLIHRKCISPRGSRQTKRPER